MSGDIDAQLAHDCDGFRAYHPGFRACTFHSNWSPASRRRRPSAIWLRAELPVQRIRTRVFTVCPLVAWEPVAGAIAGCAHREHYGYLDQNADDSRQRSAGLRSEEGDSGCNRQLKEVGRANECAWGSHGLLDLQPFHQGVGNAALK